MSAQVAPRLAAPEVFEAVGESELPADTGMPAGEPTPVVRVGELLEARTATSATFELSDGSFVTEIAAGPVHARDGSGGWVEIDTDLERTADGFTPKAVDHELVLPGAVDEPARFETEQGWVEFAFEAAGEAVGVASLVEDVEDVVPVVDGAAVTCPMGEVDLRLTATPSGVKEEVVLADASAPRAYSWRLAAAPELTATLTEGNEVEFVDAEGEIQFWVPAPFMIDASDDFDVRSSDFEVSLERDGDEWVYGLVADDDWLDAPERQWPVTIDPTFTNSPRYDCVLTSSTLADKPYCGADGLRVGRMASGAIRRTIVNFDIAIAWAIASREPVHVMGAELSMALTADSGPRFDTSLRPLTEEFNNGATWNQRTASAGWSTPGAGGGAVGPEIPGSGRGALASGSDPFWGSEPGRVFWYPTRQVQQWFDYGYSNGELVGEREFGFRLAARDETAVGEMRFHSSEAARWQDYPRLKVQWSRGIGATDQTTFVGETSVSDRSSYAVNAATGNLYVTATDLTIAGVAGHDLTVDRAYNSSRRISTSEHVDSSSEYVGAFGAGWTSMIDPQARIRTYQANNRITYTHPSGWTQAFIDRTGNGSYVSTRNSSKLRITLDASNPAEMFTVEDRATKTTEVFTSAGRLRRIIDRNGNEIVLGADAAGRVSSITDQVRGSFLTVTYNAAGLVSRITDHTGRRSVYSYSGANLTSQTLQNSSGASVGGVHRYMYGTSGQMSRITDPKGAHHDITYKPTNAVINGGGVATVTRPRGGTTTYSYTTPLDWSDFEQGPTQTDVTDARSNVTRYLSDRRGWVTRVTDARGNRRSSGFDAFGNVASFTDSKGGETTNSYTDDGLGLVSSLTAGGRLHEFDLDNAAEPFQPGGYDNPEGKLTGYGYTASGNVERVTDPVGGEVFIEHNSVGNVLWVTDGRATSRSQTTYRTVYSYDQDHRLIRIAPPGGRRRVTIDAYDALHRPIRITDGSGTSVYTYDLLGRTTSVTYPDGQQIVFGYDANGNRTSRSDASGTVYDADGNITRETFPDSRGTIDYVYDAVGNLTSMTDAAGTVGYAYNAVNLPTTITEPGGHVIRYVYKSNSDEIDEVSFPTGTTRVTQKMEYFGDGEIEEIIAERGTSTLAEVAYTYTPTPKGADTTGSLRRTRVLDNGNGTGNETTTYGYDDAGRLERATTGQSGQSSHFYEYDRAGNRTRHRVTVDGVQQSTTYFGYDAASELCWSGPIPAGTVSTANYCTSNPFGSTRYVHDAAGNLISGGGYQLGYDRANRTTTMTTPTGGALPASYAGAGQAERLTAGPATFVSSLLGVTGMVETGARTAWTRGPDGTLLGQRRTIGGVTTRSYYLTDGLGSVIAVVNQTGTVTNRYDYAPLRRNRRTVPHQRLCRQPVAVRRRIPGHPDRAVQDRAPLPRTRARTVDPSRPRRQPHQPDPAVRNQPLRLRRLQPRQLHRHHRAQRPRRALRSPGRESLGKQLPIVVRLYRPSFCSRRRSVYGSGCGSVWPRPRSRRDGVWDHVHQ
nr:DUF6531 domain-containing protein [Egicoccus halophilus]